MGERLAALSVAFGALAEGYLNPCPVPDEQALLARLRAELCEGCADFADCWGGGRNRGARL